MYMFLTSDVRQLFPPTTLFVPLLDRLCLSFVMLSSLPMYLGTGCYRAKHEAQDDSRVGFHLLILLIVVLVYWRRGRESNPPKSDRQSGALPRELPRQIGRA